MLTYDDVDQSNHRKHFEIRLSKVKMTYFGFGTFPGATATFKNKSCSVAAEWGPLKMRNIIKTMIYLFSFKHFDMP